ncbi:hypothetical protein WJX72_011052 [[Myrmecia] bisecta]|uniref:WLM domain-containing protein n=1 Tax=[Myrmecia] bisecta TaxID=41462 RepID=A0AAW1QSN8_9CHLO
MPVGGLQLTDPYKVQDIKILQKRRDSNKAVELLQKVACQVQPVMRTRCFRVPLLSEFDPRNPNLLGLNVGGGGGSTQEIKLRLRRAGDGDFYPYESVLGTMLHELTHNNISPHNASFYKLLDELTEECEDFMTKGITGSGAGFDVPGMGRLGGKGFMPVHNPPTHRLRDTIVKAAEERTKLQQLMHPGPRRLGGAGALQGLTPAQAAARAAERRAQDSVWPSLAA